MWANSSAMVVDASFLRCTQISLAWYMPQKMCAKFGATNLSVNASVNNPFVIASKRFDGFDPELGYAQNFLFWFKCRILKKQYHETTNYTYINHKFHNF